MPELVPTFERLVQLAGGDETAARFLTCYRPPAYLVGCSQAALVRAGTSVLVRNYDLDPERNDGIIFKTQWSGTPVIASSEFIWGTADGINGSGLTVSLAFGGRNPVGDGFGIPLILRYILEVCKTVSETIQVLKRIPSHMSYNITILDRHDDARTVEISPDRPMKVLSVPIATNHQSDRDYSKHADSTRSVERHKYLESLTLKRGIPKREFIAKFLCSPLYAIQYSRGFGTLYTVAYSPARGAAVWHWPEAKLSQSFRCFTEGTRDIVLEGKPVLRPAVSDANFQLCGNYGSRNYGANPSINWVLGPEDLTQINWIQLGLMFAKSYSGRSTSH